MMTPRMKAFRDLAAAYPRLAFSWRMLLPMGKAENHDAFDAEFDAMTDQFRTGASARTPNTGLLARLKLRPPVVLDIGVAVSGTPWLYTLFPDARFVLYDPQTNLEPRLKCRPARYELVEAAIGAAPGRLTLHADQGHSSLHQRTGLTATDRRTRDYTVQVRTLDDEIERLNLPEGLFVKIDAEGHEAAVIEGLDRKRDHVACVLAEVSVLNRFAGGYTFDDFVLLMRDRGFRFYATTTMPRPHQPLRFLDCVFLRKDHPAFDGG